MHPTLRAVYAAHRLIQHFLSIQLKYCTLPVSISLRRLIMVLQMMALNETVVILVNHKACDTEVKLPLIQ